MAGAPRSVILGPLLAVAQLPWVPGCVSDAGTTPCGSSAAGVTCYKYWGVGSLICGLSLEGPGVL